MQYDFGNLESPLSGTVFINSNLEPWRDALHSSHKGDSRPSYAVEGMMWVNDTTNPWILNMFDGSNDIAIGTFDTTTNTFSPSGVSSTAEDISFDNTDSGLTATNVQDAIDEAVSDFSDFESRAAGFATAAQGAAADTALQPDGDGSSLINMLYLGQGQTWQDLTASRSGDTVYTNDTGRSIMVIVSMFDSTSNPVLLIDGVIVTQGSNARNPHTVIVPNGSTYEATRLVGGSPSNLDRWAELR